MNGSVEKVLVNGRQTVSRKHLIQKGAEAMAKKKTTKKEEEKKEAPKTNGNGKSHEKETPKAEKVEKKETTTNQFDHRLGSMGPTIDALILKGTTLKEAVAILSKEFKRTEAKAKNKFLSHTNHLQTDHKITVTEKDGHYKGEVKK